MITTKSQEEIEDLKEGGKRLAEIIEKLAREVKPGVSTYDLHDMGHKLMVAGGDKPAFLGYTPTGARRPYPSSVCICVNDEIVHGVPNENPRVLEEGDIITLDAGLVHKDMYTDHAVTVAVGMVDKDRKRLLTATKEALDGAVKVAKVGGRIGDIGAVIESHAEKAGLSVVKQLTGHGVGYEVHEDPYVPNYGRKGTGDKLLAGMVLAIEPIFSLGSGDLKVASDGYTCLTKDGSPSAHFEHTVAITEDGPVVLTKG